MFPLASSQLQPNWAELARLQFEVEEELEYQARIVNALVEQAPEMEFGT